MRLLLLTSSLLVAGQAVGAGTTRSGDHSITTPGPPAVAADRALQMDYTIEDLGGTYDYTFTLTLTNGDGSWSPGQGFGWLLFGDAMSDCSPLENFAIDPDDLPVGPWTDLGSSFGYHNGPTLQYVLDCWTPSEVGESLSWSGTHDNYHSDILWSSIYTCGGADRIEFEPANLLSASSGPQVIAESENSAGLTYAHGLAIGTPGPAAAAGPKALGLEYSVGESGGLYDYDFELTLTDGDGSWAPGHGYAWLIFGDAMSLCSPFRSFEIDEDSYPVGPWTSLGSSFGYHNGPTFFEVLTCWVPTAVGESVDWSGSDDADLSELLFSSLSTCGGAPSIEFQPADRIASGPSLELDGSCPGFITVNVTNATPGGSVAIVYSPSTGSTTIPPSYPCAGTTLDLGPVPTLLTTVKADKSGHARFDAQAPPRACGLYVQALDVATCETTGVEQVD